MTAEQNPVPETPAPEAPTAAATEEVRRPVLAGEGKIGVNVQLAHPPFGPPWQVGRGEGVRNSRSLGDLKRLVEPLPE